MNQRPEVNLLVHPQDVVSVLTGVCSLHELEVPGFAQVSSGAGNIISEVFDGHLK